MDISFETPDFTNLHKLMDKESQKNIDNQENPRVKELLKEINSTEDNYEIIQLCARVHELDPDNFKIFVDQAIAFQNLKQYEKANESFQIAIVAATKTDYDYEKSLEKMKLDKVGYDKVGYDKVGYDKVGYDKVGRPRIFSKKMSLSREGYDKYSIPAKNGTPGFVFTMYAIFLMNQDKLDIALEYCDKTIHLPKSYVKRIALHVKGKILCQVGEYQKALECVDTSLGMRHDEDVKKTRDMIIEEQNQSK
jgi:tetratricopeptide (TPR) repeat protein